MKVQKIAGFLLRLAAALILWQTLRFKFFAHPESVALFTKLGVEPWGRVATGVIELVAGILMLWRPAVFAGALLGIGLMTGAIASHLLVLGIESAGDGGQLFLLAIIEWLVCFIIAIIYRSDAAKYKLLWMGKRIQGGV